MKPKLYFWGDISFSFTEHVFFYFTYTLHILLLYINTNVTSFQPHMCVCVFFLKSCSSFVEWHKRRRLSDSNAVIIILLLNHMALNYFCLVRCWQDWSSSELNCPWLVQFRISAFKKATDEPADDPMTFVIRVDDKNDNPPEFVGKLQFTVLEQTPGKDRQTHITSLTMLDYKRS